MALKRATFITYGKDEACAGTKEFIEGAGIILDIRNLDEKPFTEGELRQLIGHLSISHFLNANSPAFAKRKFDEEIPSRAEVVKAMVEDHTLIRRPIIQTSRLLTVGCDHQKISEMLQISQNNGDNEQNQTTDGNRRNQQGGNVRHQQSGGNRRQRRQQHAQSGK